MIPDEWKEKNLKELLNNKGLIKDGDWIESKDHNINGNIRLIQLSDIGDSVWLDKSNKYITEHLGVK